MLDMTTKYIFLLAFFFCLFGLAGQNKKLDSLLTIYNSKDQVDTTRLKAIQDIAWHYVYNKPDTAILLLNNNLILAQKSNQPKFEGRAFVIFANAFHTKGDYSQALKYYFKAINVYETTGNKKGISLCYGNVGLVYQYLSNYTKALDYQLKSLKISEDLGDKDGSAYSYGNLGFIYFELENYNKALEYYLKTLKISHEIGDKYSEAKSYLHIGGVYKTQNNTTLAKESFFKSLGLNEEIGNKQEIGLCYTSLGDIYYKSDQVMALDYYSNGLKLFKEIDDNGNIGFIYNTLAEFFNEHSKYGLAIQYCDSAMQVNKKIGDIGKLSSTYSNLSDIYANIGRYKDAYSYHVKFKRLTDSIFNTDNSRQLGDLKTNFEVEKKATELETEAKTVKAIHKEEKKRQQLIIYSAVGGLLIVLIFSSLLYKRFRLTNKQKQIIEEKNKEVEEKNKDILDSIRYARRIQTSLLPTDKYIERILTKTDKSTGA